MIPATALATARTLGHRNPRLVVRRSGPLHLHTGASFASPVCGQPARHRWRVLPVRADDALSPGARRLCRRCLAWLEARTPAVTPPGYVVVSTGQPALTVEEIRCSLLAATTEDEYFTALLVAISTDRLDAPTRGLYARGGRRSFVDGEETTLHRLAGQVLADLRGSTPQRRTAAA